MEQFKMIVYLSYVCQTFRFWVHYSPLFLSNYCVWKQVLDSTDHINSCKPLSRADPSYTETLEFLQKLKARYHT